MARRELPYYITIPASQTDKQFIETDTLSGILRKIWINIPSGWQFLAGIRFETKTGSQRLPSDTGLYFTGDNIPLFLEPDLAFVEDRLRIFAINNDTVNSHATVVTLEIELLDREAAKAFLTKQQANEEKIIVLLAELVKQGQTLPNVIAEKILMRR